MKTILSLGIAFFLLFALAGCGQHEEAPETSGIKETHNTATETDATTKNDVFIDWVADTLEFTSVEELIESYRLVRSEPADGELKHLAESVNFMALEKIYVPIGMPKTYQLYKILITEEFVNVFFLPEECLVSEEAIQSAINHLQHFHYSFFRGAYSMDNFFREEGVTEKDLIDGKYYFREPNSLYWALDGSYVHVDFPASREVIRGEISVVEYLGLDSVEDLARFAEIEVINLID